VSDDEFGPRSTAVVATTDRIQGMLTTPGIDKLVAAYFEPDGKFAGSDFDLLGHNPHNEVTRDDLLAVTLLDIAWKPLAVRHLLGRDAELLASLLETIDPETDLWADNLGALTAAGVMWNYLQAGRRLPGVGPVVASKLLARKRPRLVPIEDSVIRRALLLPDGKLWTTLRSCLKDPTLREQLESLRPIDAGSIHLLRLLDVALWMLHSNSRIAKDARASIGMPEQPVTSRLGSDCSRSGADGWSGDDTGLRPSKRRPRIADERLAAVST
jgi:hypothetical protein